MLKVEDIYSASNDGLDIILYYFPQADKQKHFKLREESTASASLKRIKDVWKVTDFGDDGVSRSPIDIAMREENLTFPEAIYTWAERLNIYVGPNAEINKPIFEQRAATDTEPEGHFAWEVKEKMSDFELSVWGPKVKNEHVDKYKYHALKWYSTTKDRKTVIITSTDTYPIFMRECTYQKSGELCTFRKIYQPLAADKAFRFFYKGEKPAEYINGLTELEKAFNEYQAQQQKDWDSNAQNEGKPFKPLKLDEAIICSGERDSINAAAFGYLPLWFNSETYNLSEAEYKQIMKYVDRLYNVPDIDTTGIRKGIELGMKFTDILTVWLPEWLKTFRVRGKARKDLRDFIELRPRIQDFKNLLKHAMPIRFWEQKLSKDGWRYEINSKYTYHFLWCNGFGTLENENDKKGHMYVHVQNNIVKEVKPRNIKAFINNFLDERYIDIEICNLVYNTTRLSDSNLENLKELKIDFTDYTRESQFLFFQNKVWEVTGTEVKEHKPSNISRFVWDEKVIKHDVKRTKDSFKITLDNTDDTFDIDILCTESNFFKYLINTSRMFWRKEFEERADPETAETYRREQKFNIAGPLLTAEEIAEQKIHLVNKIFAMGYLLHRYKFKDRAWCVTSIDGRIASDGESNGRSGKSFFISSASMFKKTTYISGRNPKVADNPHIFERVNKYTELIWCDDAYDYFPFGVLFDKVTNDFEVNPKNNSSYVIPFKDAGKMALTTNYMIRDNDGSTEGRLLYTVFSDYYHVRTDDNGYLETRQISDDFDGKVLFDDLYKPEEWNADLNFFADCLKFYLSTLNKLTSTKSIIKIDPPMKNVVRRRLHSVMGDNFESWAYVYFHHESENVNMLIKREDAFNDFVQHSNNKKITPQTFLKKLKAFCSLATYIHRLNPDELKNAEGRIIRKKDNKTHEMIYVQTIDQSGTVTPIDILEMVETPCPFDEDNKPL